MGVEDGEVFIYTYDGRKLNVRESEGMIYTMSNIACDDWVIEDNLRWNDRTKMRTGDSVRKSDGCKEKTIAN